MQTHRYTDVATSLFATGVSPGSSCTVLRSNSVPEHAVLDLTAVSSRSPEALGARELRIRRVPVRAQKLSPQSVGGLALPDLERRFRIGSGHVRLKRRERPELAFVDIDICTDIEICTLDYNSMQLEKINAFSFSSVSASNLSCLSSSVDPLT